MYFTFSNSRTKLLQLVMLVSVLINILFVIFISDIVVFSYLYTIVLFILINWLLGFNKKVIINFMVLNLYVLLAILLFLLQDYFIPYSFGFSGDYGGIGTDDSRFFAGIADSYSYIPSYAKRYVDMNHSFVKFLKILYPFPIIHPLSIIIPNLLGIAFIPYTTMLVSDKIMNSKKAASLSFFFVLFCPVILSNGLILMRDGWAAFLTVLGLYFIIEKRLIPFLLTLALLFYIRIGSGLILLIIPAFYFSNIIFSGANVIRIAKLVGLFVGGGGLFYFGLPLVVEYLVEKNVQGFERQQFVESIIKEADSNSILYKIYTLPIYLKVPVGFTFFLLLPFLSVNFYTNGIFNVRGIMFTFIMPVLSIYYFKNFVSGLLYAYKTNEKSIKKILYIFFVTLLLISQISIQPRHKTAVMPIFYVLVAYGVINNNKLSNQLGIAFAVMLFFVQLFLLF